MPSHPLRSAFSLVELSIVLVILGLLVGGVLSGQSLIRASELRAVTAEYQRYFAATEAFKDKYFAIPGDFNNAQAFWGQSTACGGASATGTCNGDGNGVVWQAAAVSTSGEVFQFWRQLALAGLIEGNYTGIAGPTAGNTGNDTVIGTNSPKSKITNGGWGVRSLANYVGDGGTYKYDFGNFFIVGAQQAGDWPGAVLLKPEEAWNIDTKIDDGLPTTGKVIGENWSLCSTSATFSDTTGTYKFSTSSPACSLIFAKQF